MTTYNTGNPIGSKDPRDLYDNAENLDTAVNDTSRDTWTDRLGRSRKTMSGMEREFDVDQALREHRFNTFLESSGYQFLGDYAAGIEITEYNQIVRDENGEFWRLSGEVELPYTTTGAGLPEGDAFVSVGDAVLRQDLANPDMGAAMVARGVVAVDSIADLLALPSGQRRGGLRYMVSDSVFLWGGTEFIPQGYVGVDAWLPDYAEPAEAIEAAINSGWPLDFKRLKIIVGRPINPNTLGQEIDWVSDGCVITLGTGPHEYVLRLRVPIGNHSIDGRLCFDANRNAYSGIQVLSTQGNCVFEAEKLEARNIYRAAKQWPRGDGLFFRGGFSRLHLKSPKVVGVILAPGAGSSGSVGVHGITAASDPTSGLYPLYTVLDDPHVEDVYSEDIEYTMDQDGCRLFGQSSPTAEEENSVAVVNGGEFINCAGRSIKGQVSSLIVNGTVFRRDSPLLRDFGNTEIDSQTGSLLASNIKGYYLGKAPSTMFAMSDLYHGPSTGHSIKNVSVTVKDVVLRRFCSVAGGARGPVHFDIDGVTISGSIERIALLRPNSDKLTFSINNVVADEITSEGILSSTSTGGSSPYISEGTITNVINRGIEVPLIRQRQPGNNSMVRSSSSGVVGFIKQGTSNIFEKTPATIFRAEGFSGLSGGDIATLRMHAMTIEAQDTVVFPAQLFSPNMMSVSTSLVFLLARTNNRETVAIFSANNAGTLELAKGQGVELGMRSDPGGSGLSVWMNSDLSINMKNNTSSRMNVTIMRLG